MLYFLFLFINKETIRPALVAVLETQVVRQKKTRDTTRAASLSLLPIFLMVTRVSFNSIEHDKVRCQW